MPSIQQVKPLLRLAASAGIAGVHVNAIGAAIDLRSTGLDELDQALLDPAVADVFLELVSAFMASGAAWYGFNLGCMTIALFDRQCPATTLCNPVLPGRHTRFLTSAEKQVRSSDRRVGRCHWPQAPHRASPSRAGSATQSAW